MSYTPRTIAFFCELLHPPQQPDVMAVQKLHNAMFQGGAPAYSSFAVTPGGALLSNPAHAPGAVSTVTFAADRITFREEQSSLTHDGFAERITTVVKGIAELANLQVVTAQQVLVRTLVNPRNFQDSRVFLRDGLFGFDEELTSFERPAGLFGIRLVFPPAGEQQHAYALRVESFNKDPRSIFIENQGTFGPSVLARGLEPIGQHVVDTYDFIVERALPFLQNFDIPQEA